MRNTIIIIVVGLAIISALVALKPKKRTEAANANPTTQQVAELQSSSPFAHLRTLKSTNQTNLSPSPATRAPAPIKAEDTPEAEQIRALLAEHGFEPAAFRAAYSYAYEHRRMGGLIGPNPEEGARLHLEGLLQYHRARLEKFGPLTESFLTNLQAIQPTVFIGQIDTGGAMPDLPPGWVSATNRPVPN